MVVVVNDLECLTHDWEVRDLLYWEGYSVQYRPHLRDFIGPNLDILHGETLNLKLEM